MRAVDPARATLEGRVYRVSPDGTGTPVAQGPGLPALLRGGRQRPVPTVARSGVDFRGLVLDADVRTRHTLTLTGLPSRARVSPNGRIGAMTTFVSGDSYTSPGAFSTRTNLIDLASGRTIADLEKFTVTKDGRRIHSQDFNFWGVTFGRDSDEFYATLATGAHHYLVHGSVRGRAMEVVHDNVECPSLSPDGTRIAYKRRDGNPWHWRLHVLDLKTGADVAVAERRPMDDQAEWLDNRRAALRHRRGRLDRPRRRQRPPAALPGPRVVALHAALKHGLREVHARATRPTSRWLTEMVAKGVIVASATDTVSRTPLDPRVAASLVPVANRPILFHALEAMREAGIADVAIVSCPATEDDIREAVGDGAAWGLELTHLVANGGGPAAPLHAAQAFVEDGPFILQRGDGLLGDALSSFAGLLDEERPDVVLLVHRQLARRRRAELEGRRLLRAAGVRAAPGMTGVAGVYLFGAGALRGARRALGSGPDGMGLADIVEHVPQAGGRVHVRPVRDWQRYTGDAQDLLEMNRIALDELNREVDETNERRQPHLRARRDPPDRAPGVQRDPRPGHHRRGRARRRRLHRPVHLDRRRRPRRGRGDRALDHLLGREHPPHRRAPRGQRRGSRRQGLPRLRASARAAPAGRRRRRSRALLRRQPAGRRRAGDERPELRLDVPRAGVGRVSFRTR